ncbi:hypothetical protein CRUP_015689 [Coryphaenoides rupestris]|nr:hypothetical protein CRUP_015689 [Coryphaenoides rupestris]
MTKAQVVGKGCPKCGNCSLAQSVTKTLKTRGCMCNIVCNGHQRQPRVRQERRHLRTRPATSARPPASSSSKIDIKHVGRCQGVLR